MNVAGALKELRTERVRTARHLDNLDEAIGALSKLAARGHAAGPTNTAGRRRRLSAAARRKIGAAQRARWAKWKAKHKKKA